MNRYLLILRRFLISLVVVIVTAYAGIVGYLYVAQRSILYTIQPEPNQPIKGLKIQDVRLRTPDGETLQAWYEPPQPGQPVFLFFHGQGSTLTMGKWRYVRMHKQGIGYLAVAYRGYSHSTGKPTEAGLFVDGLTAYDWLRQQGFKDGDIVIHGHSLGSGVATYVASKRPARALVLEAPFTAVSDVAQERYPFVPVSLLMKDQFRSRTYIKDIHMPLLIAHGDRDSVVPFHQGQKLFALANDPKTFVHMPGSEHNTLTRDGLYPHIWTFLKLPPADYDPAMESNP
jgi:fermentation-respiration switch protein FrsA (DUF1100 family)